MDRIHSAIHDSSDGAIIEKGTPEDVLITFALALCVQMRYNFLLCMGGNMELNMIGTDTWDCCGCELTPRMRREILMTAVEMYEAWQASGRSYKWDKEVGGLVETDANLVATIGEFLCEMTGERHPFIRWDFLEYQHELCDWLKDYLCDLWGDDSYEEDEKGNDPMLEAERQVFKWLGDSRIEDVLAWHSDLLHPEVRGTGWRIVGF